MTRLHIVHMLKLGVFPRCFWALKNVVWSSLINTRQLRIDNTGGENPSADNMANKDELRKRLVWVDLEMTGLDVDKCHILEMACLVTDSDLNVVAEVGPWVGPVGQGGGGEFWLFL